MTSDKPLERQKRARVVSLTIRQARSRQDITQTELGARVAQHLGEAEPVSQSTVSRWEHGDCLDVEQIRAIELSLRLPLGTVLRQAGYVAPAEGGGRFPSYRHIVGTDAAAADVLLSALGSGMGMVLIPKSGGETDDRYWEIELFIPRSDETR